ncbi:MAG: glycosyl transferase family 2, partial [Burkholderiaceae bacterium]|nr:glycosyl transferase family 2 [Burkholderiaceae bacterium]
ALAEPGWCAAGGRILLSESFTQALLADRISVEDWSFADKFRGAQRGQLNRALSSLWLPLGPLRRLGARRWQRLRGCNFAAFRTDVERVNGFDESFQGWGFEDSDFATRLIASGVRLKNARFATNVYHLWHRENDRTREGENWQRLQSRIEAQATLAQIGLDQYRRSPAPIDQLHV